MLRLDAIRDPEILRQIAKLLERENDKLHAKLQNLTRELSHLRGDTAGAAQRQFDALKEILAQRERELFDASSEKRPLTEPTTAAIAMLCPTVFARPVMQRRRRPAFPRRPA